MKVKKIDETTIAFQTNCAYTDHGQIIVARKAWDGVQFCDISRGIYGYVGCDFDAQTILNCYRKDIYGIDGVNFQMDRELRQIGQQVKADLPPNFSRFV